MTARLEVVIFTYNHEAFIERALKSVLSQKTDFEISLRIHDDASIDKTVDVIEQVLSSSDISWRLTQAPENRYSHGISYFHEFMAESGAEFVAILDGDDFWVDDDKLRSQVEALDHHPSAALCHHSVLEFASGKSTLIDWPPADYRRELIPGSKLAVQNIISTSSVVIRASMFPPTMPTGFNQLKIGDYPLWSLTSAGRDIAFVDRPMSAYRVHDVNIWATLDSVEKFNRELEARIYIGNSVAEEFRVLWRSGIVDAVKNFLGLAFDAERLAFDAERLALADLLAQAEIKQKIQDTELREAQQEVQEILASRSWRLIKRLREISGTVRPTKKP